MYILYFQIKKIQYKYSTLSYKVTLIKYLFMARFQMQWDS